MTVVYGNKYDRTLDVAEIAKRIRAEIKDQIKRELLPDLKASVRTRRFAGGEAIDVEITAFPCAVLNPERLAFERANPLAGCTLPRYNARASAALRQIQAIVDGYNYDGSDSQSDYFEVNFYGHVEISHKITSAERRVFQKV